MASLRGEINSAYNKTGDLQNRRGFEIFTHAALSPPSPSLEEKTDQHNDALSEPLLPQIEKKEHKPSFWSGHRGGKENLNQAGLYNDVVETIGDFVY